MKTFLISAVSTLALVTGAAEAATQYAYTIDSQSQTDQQVSAWATAETIASFYSYSSFSAHPGFALTAGEAAFFLHENTNTGVLGLGVIFNKVSGTSGSASFTVSGAPGSATNVVGDESGETPNATNSSGYSYNWNTCCTDGFAAQGFEDAAWTTIFSDWSLSGITSAVFVSGDGTRYDLGSLTAASVSVTAAAVPLPAALPMAAAGLAALGAIRTRRSRS